jgi:hypothetical protein
MRPTCKLLAAVLATLTLAGAAQAQTTLRYKYKEGDKLDYVIDQDQKMAMSVNGMDIDMKVGMAMDMSWETLKVDQDGNAKVKVTLSRVKMSMDGPTGKVDIDSKDANEPDDPIGKILGQVVKGIAGMEMTFTVDATGDMKDVKVSEGTVKKLKGLPGLDKLGEMFTPDNFKSMVSGNMVLPKDAVEKGKTWKQKMDSKMPFGKVTGETQYTYDGTIEKGGKKLDKIAVKPDVKIETDANSPIQIKVKDNKGKGYVLFDNAAGRIAESSNETTMQMELEIAGMTITQNITQNTTMRLKGKGNSKSGSSDNK